MAEKQFSGRTFSSRILLLSLFFLISLISPEKLEVSGAAEETEKTEEMILADLEAYRGCIVRIEAVCWDGESEIYDTRAFSGFVVSEDTTGVHIITVQSGLSFTEEEKQQLRKEYNLEDNDRISEKIEVVFRGDLRVEAGIIGESSQRNLTVLRLNQTIHFDQALLFIQEEDLNKEAVYLLSYPGETGQGGGLYNEENVRITRGVVLRSYQEEEVAFFQHDIQADQSSKGGPLLNRDGLVTGILLTAGSEAGGTAICASSVKEFLRTFNISYQEYEKTEEKEKIPVLNLILGGIVLGLLAANLQQFFKSRNTGKTGERKRSVRTKKRAAREKTERIKPENRRTQEKRAQAKEEAFLKRTNASLEYPAEKRIALINKIQFVIGREDADFVFIDNKEVSRKHAGIRFDGKDFYLTDLRSTNYTLLNGMKLVPGEKKKLEDGDEISVGKEKLIFHRR